MKPRREWSACRLSQWLFDEHVHNLQNCWVKSKARARETMYKLSFISMQYANTKRYYNGVYHVMICHLWFGHYVFISLIITHFEQANQRNTYFLFHIFFQPFFFIHSGVGCLDESSYWWISRALRRLIVNKFCERKKIGFEPLKNNNDLGFFFALFLPNKKLDWAH